MEKPADPFAAEESRWYEVIENVVQGRAANLVCPECNEPGLVVEEQGTRCTVTCTACQRQVEFLINTE